ncbi:MAG: methionyl-tRNA formyltransferase [Chloroflexi bacterium]|nr:methionyl-tRNA formyltransferase [Chloroflexota bacterium]
MGTPQFAVPSLRALANEAYVITVVTQPDRPAGRGDKLTPPPVKVAAEELDLTVLQPPSLRDPAFRAQLAALQPDLTVLVAYGEYLPSSLLDLPKRGSINLHPSLLPRWRGSTPVQSAILAGDLTTGVSVILMDQGLDTGPLLSQEEVPIEPHETSPQLSSRLAEVGAQLLSKTIRRWLRGEIEPVPQGEEGATLTHTLTKEAGEIKWNLSAIEIERRVRALQPWPGTYTWWQHRLLKIISAEPLIAPGELAQRPGTVALIEGRGQKIVSVWTGAGALRLLQVQLEGKPVIEARALLAGYPQIVGSVLGSEAG